MWEPKHFEVTFQLYILNLDGKENRKFDLCWNKYPNHFIEDN